MAVVWIFRQRTVVAGIIGTFCHRYFILLAMDTATYAQMPMNAIAPANSSRAFDAESRASIIRYSPLSIILKTMKEEMTC